MKLKLYLAEMRAPFLTASIFPVTLGAAIAWARTGVFHWGWFLLTLIGGVLIHAGINIANDYWDHKSGADEANVEYIRPFTGGSRFIQQGLLSPNEVLWESIILLAASAAIGIYLSFTRSWIILLLGVIGMFSGYFYTAPPVRLAARGVGEIAVGVNFSLLMALGAFVVQTQWASWEPVIAAIPLALLISAVLTINEFPDARADGSVGKNHMVVRLGKLASARIYAAMMGGAYLTVLILVLVRVVPPYGLVALVTIPLGLKAIRVALTSYDGGMKLAPANAGTVMVHLATGLLLSLAYVFAGFRS